MTVDQSAIDDVDVARLQADKAMTVVVALIGGDQPAEAGSRSVLRSANMPSYIAKHQILLRSSQVEYLQYLFLATDHTLLCSKYIRHSALSDLVQIFILHHIHGF